jgi:acyl carrier protein
METKVEKFKKIIAESLGVPLEEIKPESELINDLNAGPLEIADIIMKIKKEFQIEIPDDEIENFVTVNDLLNLIIDEE